MVIKHMDTVIYVIRYVENRLSVEKHPVFVLNLSEETGEEGEHAEKAGQQIEDLTLELVLFAAKEGEYSRAARDSSKPIETVSIMDLDRRTIGGHRFMMKMVKTIPPDLSGILARLKWGIKLCLHRVSCGAGLVNTTGGGIKG